MKDFFGQDFSFVAQKEILFAPLSIDVLIKTTELDLKFFMAAEEDMGFE